MPRRVEPPGTPDDAFDGEKILRLALSVPRQAIAEGQRIVISRPDPERLSYALQAVSVAHREMGEGGSAVRYARRALAAAERSGLPHRSADARATLGATLALVGRTREALPELDAALAGATGVHAARIRMRRGGVLRMLGRHDEALGDLRVALPGLRAAHDIVYEARALTQRALVYDDLGDWAKCDRDLSRSEQLLQEAGQRLESIWARQNRGHVAFRAGQLPVALGHYDAAEKMHEGMGAPDAALHLDRCRALLAAGMPGDARRHAEQAVRLLQGHPGTESAEAMLMTASAALAAGDDVVAATFADSAARAFRGQQQRRWVPRAQRVALLARWMGGERSRTLLRQSGEVADELTALHEPHEAVEAHLLAGRVALSMDAQDEAARHLRIVAAARRRGPAMTRATGWLARALLADSAGDSAALMTACRRGLDVLDEHRLAMGATEMRARATVHGSELALLATRHAATSRDATQLLRWSERWRATTLTAAPVRPPDDDELARDLSALRDVTIRLGEARAEGAPTGSLEREQARIEASVRQRMLRTRGSATGAPAERLDVRRLRAELGDTTLLAMVEVDGTLHVVTVSSRRSRMHTVGPVDVALSELEYALFALRRIAAASSPALVRASGMSLRAAADSLQKALLGNAIAHLGDGPVLVVPSGRLHAVPWSLLAALRDREVTVAPSATSWLRARATQPPRRHKVTLVVGPGLETGGGEVARVVPFYPDAHLLDGVAATADDVLDALDGASLAHVAAHGSFRSDNALFSSLRMADGPLTVHDLERLRRPPHRLVLSSCDSGLGEVAGADELLGLSSALIGMGCAGLLASVVQVNDLATVPLMVAVHEQLRGGATLGQALHQARMNLGDDDPVLAATGQSFIALGAA